MSVFTTPGPRSESKPALPKPTAVTVQVVRPRKANIDRTTKWLPCEVHSYGWAPLFAEVSGYLKEQQLNGKPVDIGTKVKKGDVLARIDVPELEQQVKRHEAGVEQANARVVQMQARVTTAEADLDAAKAAVTQAEAAARSAEAWSRFRHKQLGRMEDLFALKSIDERLVDESRERWEASMETVRSTQAAIATAVAQRKSAEAKIVQANADVLEAKAQVKVAEAELKRAEVLVGFATITSPYDGIVTQRSLLPGGFVRSAAGGSNQAALLTVEETDKMRVVVQVPDRDLGGSDRAEGRDQVPMCPLRVVGREVGSFFRFGVLERLGFTMSFPQERPERSVRRRWNSSSSGISSSGRPRPRGAGRSSASPGGKLALLRSLASARAARASARMSRSRQLPQDSRHTGISSAK